MKVINLPQLNAWVQRDYRKGWQLDLKQAH